ncbi:ArsR family transcriptional regulator [archaeon]|nr:MAG: ArsR family transcriptional regulator [archaeon]
MNDRYGDTMVDEDKLFNLLGNETRRMILRMLSSGPCYTTEIAEKLNVGQKAINEHMRLLQEAGLVDLYVQKQSRGSPRKYFKINKSVRLEFFIGPYRFDTSLAKLFDGDFKKLFLEFPQLKEFEEKVKKSRHIREISKLSLVFDSLNEEHAKITQAKDYIEHKMDQVRQQCISVCDQLGLDDTEKRIVLEIVSAGGVVSTKQLAERLNIEEDRAISVLSVLEDKGILLTQ